MSEEWRNFDDKAKEPYEKMAEKERERYEREKAIYDAKKAAESAKESAREPEIKPKSGVKKAADKKS